MRNAYRRLFKSQPVTLFTFAQRPFKSLAALEDFLHVDVGCGSFGDEIAKKQLPLSHLIDAMKQILGNGSFYDISAGAGIESLPHHLGGVVLAENQDVDGGKSAPDFTRGFEAVEPRHADVHDDQVGTETPGLFDGIPAVARFATDFDIRPGLQERSNASAHQLVIVGDENSHLEEPPKPCAVFLSESRRAHAAEDGYLKRGNVTYREGCRNKRGTQYCIVGGTLRIQLASLVTYCPGPDTMGDGI
jgi:hypothetical protein